MIVANDPVYIEGWRVFNLFQTLTNYTALLSANAGLYSAFHNLGNALRVARGDAEVGGTPVDPALYASWVSTAGELTPAIRASIITLTAELNAASGNVVTTDPVTVSEPFLGGILDGEIFGIDKKLIAVGLVAFFFLKGK